MEKLTTIALVSTNISTKQTLHPHKIQIFSLCYPMVWAKWSIQQHNNTYIVMPPQLWTWACIYKAQWIGIVERFVDEVAPRSYDGGSRAQLTHNARDKGGNKAHDLEASRNFSFSHFNQGTTFFSLWQSILGENRFKDKALPWWHCFYITGHRRC